MPSISFQAFQDLDLPLSEIVSGRIGFIHDLFLTFPYEIVDELPEGDRDLVVLTGKGDRREKLDALAEYAGRVLLVLAPGDASFRAGYLPGRSGLPPNIVAAYVTNNELADQRVINIPLGVRINKLRAIKFVRQNHSGGQDDLLYGNFTLNDEHYRPDKQGLRHIRARLVEQLQDAPWARLEISRRDRPVQEAEALVRYYSQIARHRFVLSPEGNGIDCYRTWESLYLGAVPIVMVSPCMTTFSDLPILFTEDYSEITEEYLEARWREFSSRSFEIRSLLKSHYFQHFLGSVALLDSPRFICWGFRGTADEKFHRILERSSRSPSDILAEAPTPPFIDRLSLIDPGAWRSSGDVAVERRRGELQIIPGSGRPATAELRLNTIAGGPFRLTGYLHADGNRDKAELLVTTDDGATRLAGLDLDGAGEAAIDLEFVAEGDRSVLVMNTGRSRRGATYSLGDLSLTAQV